MPRASRFSLPEPLPLDILPHVRLRLGTALARSNKADYRHNTRGFRCVVEILQP